MTRLPIEKAFREMVVKDLYALAPEMGVTDDEVKTVIERNLDTMSLDFVRPIMQLAYATGAMEILMDKELRFNEQDFHTCKGMLKNALRNYKFERKAPLN